MAFTAAASAEDYNDTTAKIAYYSESVFPQAKWTYTPTAADDGLANGVYELTISGDATLRSCTAGVTGAGSTVTIAITTTTTCATTYTWAADGTITFNIVTTKLAAGDQAEITVTDPDGDVLSTAITNARFIEGVAAANLANKLSASKTAATIKVDYDGDGTVGEATDDVADTTIGSVDYIATAQNLGSVAIFGGILQNGYGNALDVDTTIVATVTGGNYVNCDEVPGGGVADGSVNVVALTVADATSDFECEVISPDGAEGQGGAWTLTITTVTGTVLDTFSAGFLGEIATVTAAAAYDTVVSDAAGDIADFLTVTAKDASGRAYAAKDLIDADNLETDPLLAYDNADTTEADIAATSTADGDTDGIFDLDKEICDNNDGPTAADGYETRSVIVQLEDGANETVQSNTVTLKCGVDKDTALVVDHVAFADSQVAPGGSVKANVYMEDANGYAASPTDVAGADVSLVLTNGVNADITADNDVEAAATTIVEGGYFEVTIVAPITVGTTISIYNATSGSLARAYVTSDAYDAVLTVGPKKLKATADFGPAAGRKKIAFVLENASGTTKTFYRRANSDGVATYTLRLRGSWTVYATFGDEITDTGAMSR